MQQLPQELIERALALTGKTIKDMYVLGWTYDNEYIISPEKISKLEEWDLYIYFCIKSFCFYLLSPEFIEEFYYKSDMSSEWKCKFLLPQDFWIAINFFQDWNSQPLIDLLEKI